MKLSIIIPVYNEESTLEELLAQVIAVELKAGLEKEIIVVDDGSTDGSLEVMQRIQLAQADLVKVHASPVNFGKGAAVRLGFNFATGDIILIQDADLELSPQEYNRLLEPILAGEAAVVYGSRFQQTNRNIPRKARLANRFLTWLTNRLFRGRITDMETAYKLFRAELPAVYTSLGAARSPSAATGKDGKFWPSHSNFTSPPGITRARCCASMGWPGPI